MLIKLLFESQKCKENSENLARMGVRGCRQDGDWWAAVVSAVMNFQLQQKRVIYLLGETLSASMGLVLKVFKIELYKTTACALNLSWYLQPENWPAVRRTVKFYLRFKTRFKTYQQTLNKRFASAVYLRASFDFTVNNY
jgi:hypothetical protein